MVNSFLQMLDGYRGRSLLIAATNHEKLLDRALWRRFDEVLLFAPPSSDRVAELLRMKLRGVRSELPLDDGQFLAKLSSMSHSDIERIVIRAIKLMILKGREFVTPDLFEAAMQRELERQNLVARL